MAGGNVVDITSYVLLSLIHPSLCFRYSWVKNNPLTTRYSEAEFNQAIQNDAVLIDFFAEWCGPCKAISPKIEELSTQHTNIKFFKVDVDKLSEVAAANGISAMPTFLFFKGGEKVETVRGANPPAIMAGIQKIA